jgi:hypothetical protein
VTTGTAPFLQDALLGVTTGTAPCLQDALLGLTTGTAACLQDALLTTEKYLALSESLQNIRYFTHDTLFNCFAQSVY